MVLLNGVEVRVRDMTLEQRRLYNARTQTKFRNQRREKVGDDKKYTKQETICRTIRLYESKLKRLRDELTQLKEE
jgi:hypothetical protein